MGKIEPITLMRSPIDTNCADPGCKKPLPFGIWVYFVPENNQAICVECGVKRGWTPKRRIKNLIKELELKEDIKVLKHQRKREIEEMMRLEQRIKIFNLGENDLILEAQIVALMNTVKDYLGKSLATPDEKEGLKKVFETIRSAQDLQKKIREEVDEHLWLLEKKERDKKKKKQRTLTQEIRE